MERLSCVLFGLCLFVFGCSSGSSSDEDYKTDTGANTDTDTDPLLPITDCRGGKYDPNSGLCWQDPPSTTVMNWYEAAGVADPALNPGGAVDYVGDLNAGDAGVGGWRLPKIDELITLIRGCQNRAITDDLSPSLCTMTPENCSQTDTCDGFSNCGTCSSLWGPGSGGCYWDPALSGACGWYWSSPSYAPNSGAAWRVNFNSGYVDDSGKGFSGYVRCVRPGP